MTIESASIFSDSCLAGGGEMGALMRAFDWSATALGPVSFWPRSLKTTVSICLNSQFPMILWWGPELTVIYNDGYIPMLGIKHPDRALGRPGRECWAEVWDVVGPLLERVMIAGEANWADDLLLFINRSGYPEETYFRFSYSPVRDESGGIGGVFTPVSETTGKVIAERRLRTLRDLSEHAATAKEPRAALRAAVDVLAANPWDVPFVAMYLFDREHSSASFVASAGISSGAASTPETVDLAWPLWNAAVQPDISVIDAARDLFHDLPAGPWGEPPRTIVVVPISSAAGQLTAGFMLAGVNSRRRLDEEYRSFFALAAGQIGAALANADAFEQERLRAEALAEIDRAKTAFFSNISHEFRTPLTLLLGPLEESLLTPRSLDPDIRSQLEIAYRNALRLLRLVNALLDFSRIEAGRAQATFVPVEPGGFTADLAGVFRAAIERAGLRFKVDCKPLDSPILIDREMWENIVFNLLSNAFKFTLSGEIGISVRPSRDMVELAVWDTGAGIAPAELPRIFERFHRVDGTPSRTHEGTGIGLALVKELVTLHGGEIRVESEQGRGSRFTVTIPARPAVDGIPATASQGNAAAWLDEMSRWRLGGHGPEATPDETPGAGPTILLADDNADMREYAARLLRARFRVVSVADGEQALAAIRAHPPDLVLSDVMMPRLDGFGLLAALRSDPATRQIPVILLSARAGEESRIQGMQAGADDYIVKPFSSVELMARIEAHLKLARARKASAAELRASEEFNRSIVESGEDAICVLTLTGEILSLNAHGAEMAGIADAKQAVGKSWIEVFPGADPKDITLAIQAAASGGSLQVEFPCVRGGGEQRWLNATFSAIRSESGARSRILAVARDLTEQKRVEQQLMLLVRASATLLASTPEAVVETIIQLAQEFVAADAYSVWRRESSDVWRMVFSSGLSPEYGASVQRSERALDHTMAVEDVLASEYLRHRREHYAREGIRSMITAPLRSAGEVTGTLVLYYRSPHHFSPSEITICTALGNMAAAAVESARMYQEQLELREQAEEARTRATFLAQAGAILASSLDVEQTLRAISELAVPRIADWCAVDLLEPDGPPRRVTVRHANPALVEKAAVLRAKYPPRQDMGFAQVLRTGKTMLVSDVTDEALQAAAQSAEHLAGLRELGIRSCVLAPLTVHGEKLGVLTLVRSERRFEPQDVPFIEEIAQRAAFAVHSARLHHTISESAERLNVATAAAGLGIFEWNMETGEVAWENDQMFRIFARPRELGPIPFDEFFSARCHPEDAPKLRNEIETASSSRKALLHQTRIRRDDGEWIWAEFSGQFDLSSDGRARRLVGVVADVTQRRKFEEKLREKAKLESVGLLAGGVAHDFNNLLTGILGNASLALDMVPKSHMARPMIEGVLAASERAASLTQQMLAYSGRGRFVIAPVHISKLVRDLAGLLRTSIDRSIDLRLELDDSLPSVEADAVQMQQLVMNLIINAAESMEGRQGAITVRAFLSRMDGETIAKLNPEFDISPGWYVCLEVTDQGCGMDEATMAKIFDPFFTTKFTGRGLGLSAVLGIVRGHKGSLAVSSRPGEGTTFRIHLPPMAAPVRDRETAPGDRLGTVLIVDDEEIVRNTAAHIIESVGFRAITAQNGAEALQEFTKRDGRIDLTILDLAMPVMRGEETIARIQERWPDARIVVSTGFGPAEAARHVVQRGIAGVLHKPYTVARVAQLIRELGIGTPRVLGLKRG